MKTHKSILAVFAAFLIIASPAFAAGEHRIGVGANYWVSLKDLDVDDVDDNGFSYLVSYQYWDGLWGLELNAEFLPDRFGENAWAPEAYLIFGDGLYAAVGIGIIHTDGDFESSPFYALRVGFDFEIISSLHIDISANYRFNDTADLSGSDTRIDTDTVFLGAALRLAF